MTPLKPKTMAQFVREYPAEYVRLRKWPYSVFEEEDAVEFLPHADKRFCEARVTTDTRSGAPPLRYSAFIFEKKTRVVNEVGRSLGPQDARVYASLIEACAEFCERIEKAYAKYVADLEREAQRRTEAIEQLPLVQALIDRASYASVQVDGYLVEIRQGALLSIKPVPTHEDENEETEED